MASTPWCLQPLKATLLGNRRGELSCLADATSIPAQVDVCRRLHAIARAREFCDSLYRVTDGHSRHRHQ
jgi:hypothetical protein